MADTLGTIVPIILILVGVIWIWSVFGEPIKRFYEWIKNMTGAGRDRFKAANPAQVVKEFTYS